MMLVGDCAGRYVVKVRIVLLLALVGFAPPHLYTSIPRVRYVLTLTKHAAASFASEALPRELQRDLLRRYGGGGAR